MQVADWSGVRVQLQIANNALLELVALLDGETRERGLEEATRLLTHGTAPRTGPNGCTNVALLLAALALIGALQQELPIGGPAMEA